MNALTKRLERLEASAFREPARTVRRFIVQGPADMPEGASVEFLRACGHDISDGDLNLVRLVISADPSEPLELQDLTPGNPAVREH